VRRGKLAVVRHWLVVRKLDDDFFIGMAANRLD